MEVLRWLFDTSEYMTRSVCGDWPDGLKWAWLLANGSIAFAYFAISALLYYLRVTRRGDIAPLHSTVLNLFAAFIVLCGATHVAEITVFYWAPYRFYTVLFAVTGVVSLAALVVLPIAIRELSLTRVDYLSKLNDSLRDEIRLKDEAVIAATADRRALERQNESLGRQVARLQRMRETGVWASDQEDQLDDLLSELRSLELGRSRVDTTKGGL